MTPATPSLTRALPWLGCFLLAGCGSAEGLRLTPAGTGPTIVVDWDADPLPELPFPNDLATRVDPGSPTGLRLNFSADAPTELERTAREKVNELSGFGLYSPITVRFDAPLDLDRIAARHADDGDTADDLVLVVDVTLGSPTFGQIAPLDVGAGRFPLDLFETDNYFLNDPRSESPTLLFETVEEDLNGNGLLDPGEDTDGDGTLDHPNVYPEGGDPRSDLLTWYERETDTLIVRPAVPLREETTYAVLLTEELVGTDGAPVRSPWEWVNHTRQTDALEPILEMLPGFGHELDDLAFAWTFTTGRVTGDLVDVRRGLHGEGPFARLATEYPAGLSEAVQVREVEGENNYRLPAARIVGILDAGGFFPAEAADLLTEGYAFADAFVGASFTTPNLLTDRDDGGRDDTDEWWQIDAMTGEMSHAPAEVAMTCLLPKADAEHQPPFPVTIYGHGYKSDRSELLLFGWTMNRVGIATCAFELPGHGVYFKPEDREIFGSLLEAAGLYPFLQHLEDGRARDVNNDGEPDSGADQWIADSFHTRDMVRQAVVDTAQAVRALKACGTASSGLDIDGDGQDEVTCDWDADGVADIGGPGVPIHLMGGSLGGIIAGISAAVEPDLDAVAAVVPGGGLMDVGWRSALPGVIEAVAGRVMSPMVVGLPGEAGFQIVQNVNSGTKMRQVHVATLPEAPTGGSFRVENLSNGEVREVPIPADGRFRIGIPSDALDPYEKRVATGMPDRGPELGQVYEVTNNEGLGDRWRITLTDESGTETVLETFEQDVVHEGVTMRAGSPLVAASDGLGHVRGTPRLRRVVNVLSLVTEPGDPIAYAPHYFDEPFEELGGRPANILLVPMPGDPVVPTATGIALARAAGLFDMHAIDPRYGTSVDRFLIDHEVVHGVEEDGPYTNPEGEPVLFDADDLDQGLDGFGAPSEAPLRLERVTESGTSGLRLPMTNPRGMHGYELPDAETEFDMTTFSIMQVVAYAQSLGQEINDDLCLEDMSCASFRTEDDLPPE